MRKNLNGFTAVEILMVISIIGILSTISLVSFSGNQVRTRDAQRSAKTTILAEALEKYYDNNGEYPGCQVISGPGGGVTKNVLPGVEPNTLLTPKSVSTETNSIKCQDLAVGGSDVFAYLGDSSTTCNSGQACLNFTLKYIEESTGQVKTITSRRKALDPPITIIADNFNRTGATLGITSTTGIAWNVLSGSWSTNGVRATTSSTVSTNPVAVVDSTRPNVDVSADIGTGDAIYFRATDATNWWRVREQTNAHPYTYYTSDPYTYYTYDPYTYYTYDPYTYYTYSYSPGPWVYYGSFCENGSSYPATGTYYGGMTNGYYSYYDVHQGIGSGGCRYYWDKNGVGGNTRGSAYSYGLGFNVAEYTRTINQYSTANTGYMSVAHTGYNITPHTGYMSVAHTGYTAYYGLVLEKSVGGTISQVWAQPDTTTRPTLARVVASGNNIAVYSSASGSPLTTKTDSFGATFTKHGIGRGGSNPGSSGIDNFSVVNQ